MMIGQDSEQGGARADGSGRVKRPYPSVIAYILATTRVCGITPPIGGCLAAGQTCKFLAVANH